MVEYDGFLVLLGCLFCGFSRGGVDVEIGLGMAVIVYGLNWLFLSCGVMM